MLVYIETNINSSGIFAEEKTKEGGVWKLYADVNMLFSYYTINIYFSCILNF